MKTAAAALTALLTLTAAAPAGAQQIPLVQFDLDQGRTQLPIFLVEAEALMGELDVDMRWTVNGRPVDEAAQSLQGAQLLDIRSLPLTEASVVCVEMTGRLMFSRDMGQDVEERACVSFEPGQMTPKVDQRTQ